MMIIKRDEKDPEDFWKEMEEELGEKVQVYTLGRCLHGDGIEFPMWGLFFTTVGRFCFRYYKQENWFDALVRIGGIKKSEPDEVAIDIIKKNIQSLDDLTSKKLWNRLLGNSSPTFRLKYLDQDVEKELFFTVAMKSKELIKELTG